MRLLPEGWSAPTTAEDSIVVDGVCLHRAGVAATAPSGEEITGSAAGPSPEVAARGWFELLERASTIEALGASQGRPRLRDLDGVPVGSLPLEDVFPQSDDPGRWRFGRSNGVALHRTWGEACQRALWELVERDRVLRAWYGETTPRRLTLDREPLALAGLSRYEWCAYAFGDADAGGWADAIEVAGVFGFPREAGLPLVAGWGARPHREDAVEVAAAEATQQLAFLWGEALPEAEPAVGPTAMHHLEHLIWPGTAARLRAWLEGEHRRFAVPGRTRRGAASPPVFVDLTPPWLDGELFVARAICADAVPLTFGDAPFGRHLPPPLRAHPIA